MNIIIDNELLPTPAATRLDVSGIKSRRYTRTLASEISSLLIYPDTHTSSDPYIRTNRKRKRIKGELPPQRAGWQLVSLAWSCWLHLTLQVQFALWTLQQHRAHRVQIVVGTATQGSRPRLRYLQRTECGGGVNAIRYSYIISSIQSLRKCTSYSYSTNLL